MHAALDLQHDDTETTTVTKKGLRQVNIRFAADDYHRLEQTADALRIDLAQFLRSLIMRHLPAYEEQARELRDSEPKKKDPSDE